MCSVSANSAAEPVSAAATPLAIAIAVLAASAAKTLVRLASRPSPSRVLSRPSTGAKPSDAERDLLFGTLRDMPGRQTFLRVLVAIDGSRHSDLALEMAIA